MKNKSILYPFGKSIISIVDKNLLWIPLLYVMCFQASAQLGPPDLQIMETLRDNYGWDVAFGWGSGNPCPVAGADWPGVICNNGRVTELQLACGANKLTTDFPAELNQLTELTILQITGCWTDPNNPATAKDLTNLSKLNILRLDDNTGLTGTLQDLLGNSMASFPNFQILEITNSGIGGIIPPDMPGNVRQFIIQTRVGGTLPNNRPNTFRYIGNQLEGVLSLNWVNATPSGDRWIDYNKLDVVNTLPGPIDNAQPGWRNTQTVPPTDVQVTPTAPNEATLSWTPIGYTWDGGYYEVLASPTPGGPYTSYGKTSDKTATGLSVTGLPGGANYFVVRTFTPAHIADSLEVYQAYNDPSSLPFQPILLSGPRPSFQDTLNFHRTFRDNPNDLTSVNSAEVSAFICPGSILYVNDDAGGNDDGTSWADAFNDLQDALALAASCPNVTEIWVAEGAYTPTTCTSCSTTDREAAFAMKNNLAIYGGFPNTGNPTFADRDWAAHETILSGDIDGEGTLSNNSYHVFFHNGIGLDNSALLDGFTITGGNADGTGSLGSSRDGGGMLNINASPSVRNCKFIGNAAAPGAGTGGGMDNFESAPRISNCIFHNNSASLGGGMANISFIASAPQVINCTFSGNSADISGGGMVNAFSAAPIITNCILWGNGSEIVNNNGSTPTVSFSIVQGGYASCANCPGGDGNVDPLFVDAANGDLRLQAGSPAIDAGDGSAGTSINTTGFDLDGNPRFSNGLIDLGAYEFQAALDVSISDPCTCLNNATRPGNGQFSETVQVTGPTGDTWTVKSVTGLFLPSSPAPPAAPIHVSIGDPVPETASGSGVYELQGIHIDGQGYTITLTNGSQDLSISNICYYPLLTINGLQDRYCANHGPVDISVTAQLGDSPAPATVQTAGFTLLNAQGNPVGTPQSGPATTYTFNPVDLPSGAYRLRVEVDTGDDGASHPGCVQPIEQPFEVRQVGCGVFPWDGD